MLWIIAVDIRTCPLRPILILYLVWWWRCRPVASIVRCQAEVSWKVSVLCAGCSSVLQIVGLRPPIPSNHRFRDEVQGSSKPSQSSLSLQSTRPVRERQISSPDTKPVSGRKRDCRTICSVYTHQHPFLCRVALRSSLCECSWPPDSVCF